MHAHREADLVLEGDARFGPALPLAMRIRKLHISNVYVPMKRLNVYEGQKEQLLRGVSNTQQKWIWE